MSKHTPGPWICEPIQDENLEIIGYDVAACDFEPRVWSDVCEVRANRSGPREVTEEEAKANANLIAAAPDLLEQLKAVYAMCKERQVAHGHGDYGDLFYYQEAFEQRVLAAIRKAEGGAA